MSHLKDSSEFREAASLLGGLLGPRDRKRPGPSAPTPAPTEKRPPVPERPGDTEPAPVALMPLLDADEGREEEASYEAPPGLVPMSEPIFDAEEAAAEEEETVEVLPGAIEDDSLGAMDVPMGMLDEEALEEVDAEVEVATEADEGPAPVPAPVEDRTVYRSERLERTVQNMCKRGDFNGAIITDKSGLPLAAYNIPGETDVIAATTTMLGDALQRTARYMRQPNANNLSIDINYTEKLVLKRFDVRAEHYYMLILCSQLVDERGELELSIDQIVRILD